MPEINIINLTVAPKGATHYKQSPLCFFKYSTGKDKMYYFTDGIWIELEHWPPASTVKKIEEWTIYTNTFELGALTDEQYGKMRRAADAGADVEVKQRDIEGWVTTDDPSWDIEAVYRIKPKSDRDLFVEKCIKIADGNDVGAEYFDYWFSRLFDAGCRFVNGDK